MNIKVAVIFIVIGAVAGWLASFAMGENRGSPVRNLGIGIVGAVIGGYGVQLLDLHTEGLLGDVVVAFVGSVILLWIIRQFS